MHSGGWRRSHSPHTASLWKHTAISLGAGNDLLLGELAFKHPTEGLPERRVDLVRHHLDHRDIVPLQIAAAVPKTCPGARTKLVAPPNLSVNSCRSSSKRVCVTG
jgi:hypothetical protein